MPTQRADFITRHLRQFAHADACHGLADRELLGRFAAGRDEAAFRELLRRHGPMVLRVCRLASGSADTTALIWDVSGLVVPRAAPADRRADGLTGRPGRRGHRAS